MKIISDKSKLIKFINKEKNLGFVPTMGALHKGHISLVKKSLQQCNRTIVSIFVNKPQFEKKIDYSSYPRILKKDIAILKKLKVDILYIPRTKQIYPYGPNKKIKISPFAKELCGKSRPGHFKAVVDVVDRFIKIINPKKIFLGEKDMQQLKIIENFIKNRHKYTNVVGCKTIRDLNGLALSSRNFLLTKNEKKIGSKVFKLLFKNKSKIVKNNKLLKKIKNDITILGVDKIDYLKIINVNMINKPYNNKKKYKIFIAYYLRNIRLIDNI